MKQANFAWDAKTLDAYLSDPQKIVPGNKMPFPGLKTDHDRADVIAYLTAPAGASAAASPQQAPAAEQHAAAPTQQTPQGAAERRQRVPFGRQIHARDPALQRDEWSILGVGGAIDGKVNPILTAAEGQVIGTYPDQWRRRRT